MELLDRIENIRREIKSAKKDKDGKITHIVSVYSGKGDYVKFDDLVRVIDSMKNTGAL